MILRRVLTAAIFALPALPCQLRAQEEDDHAKRRWEYFYQQRAFPFERIPAGALERARTQLSARFGINARIPAAISGSRWQAIGPRAIPSSGTSIGRISTIAVHPTNPNMIYIGGAQGGVWRTTDGGTTWTALTDRECSLAMGSLAIDPVAPTIIYAATGEQHFSGDSYYGCGVLRSTDGGNTWTRLGASVFVRSRISRVLIVPSTAGTVASTRLLLAADSGLYRSADGGATWTLSRAGTFTDVVLDPSNENTVYAAVRRTGIFRSEDGGATWTALNTGIAAASLGRINLAISRSNPRVLYASVENTTTGALLGIWKTVDGGTTWAQVAATGTTCNTQCWYDMTLIVHPTNENLVYFGGLSLYRSFNGGESFTNIGNTIHVDHHHLVWDPTVAERLYSANDGGIYRSNDAGTTWTSLNAGLELTQFYGGISLHPSEFSIVLGGTQDNGTLRFTNSPTWGVVLGGDGGFTAIHADNPAVQFAETQWSATGGGPRRSDGGGFVRKVNGINTADAALFIPPLVMDPVDSRVLYFGTVRLYKTTDLGENWSAISPAFVATARVAAIAPAAADPATVYLGLTNGQVQVTRNSGATWDLRTSGLPVRSITDIAVDRTDPLIAVVTFSGFGTPHVYRTTDGGVSWSNVSGNLPDLPVNAVVLDPGSRSTIMIGTDLGVFISENGGASWTALTDGMPNVAVFDIAYNPATASLVAATHGRGMFQLQLNRPLTLAVVPQRRRASTTDRAGAPPLPDSTTVLLTGTGSTSAAWSATHRPSATWLTLSNTAGTGTGRLRWSRNPAGLTPGTYVDTIRVSATGATDSPGLVVDTLVVEPSVAVLTVSPASRRVTMNSGETPPRADSASVSLPGAAGAAATWSAAARRGTWLRLTTASGTGSGTVRWTRDAAALNMGAFIDTIVVSSAGAIGSPFAIVDSLIVLPVLALAPAARRDTLRSGASATSVASHALTIRGDPENSLAWTVTHGSARWLTLNTTSGRGSGTVSWTRSAANLRDGMYIDTVTITAGAARAVHVDTLVVTAPAVARTCAVDHLFGRSCLDAAQLRWLDLIGNNDGVYNLGDLAAYLERGTASPRPAVRRRDHD